MTFLAHASQAYVVTKLVTQSEEIAVANAIIATYPDLITLREQRENRWGFYLLFHDVKNWMMLLIAPAAWLHALIDSFTHNEFGRWYWWTYVLEAGWWLFFVAYIFT